VSRLADGRRFQTLEELATFCTLGVRFWDATTDAQIRNGLQVRIWPEAALRPVQFAARTYSDIYAFHRLPGLVAVERPMRGLHSTVGSPGCLHFILEVVDLQRRFVPSAIGLSLPLPDRGLFPTQLPGSPALGAPGFYLFSAPTRSRGPNIAVIRGELMNGDTGGSAAYALVRVEIPGETPAYTVSNADGAFAVHLPFPALPGGLRPLDASPPGPLGPPIADRTWQLRVSVFYQPVLLPPLPGTEYPDVRNIFSQARADIFLESDSPPVVSDNWPGILDFGGEVVVRTGDLPILAVAPATSPP
jgi:hypothetical protein